MLVVSEAQMNRFKATIVKIQKDMDMLTEAISNLDNMLNIVQEIEEEKVVMSVDPKRLYIEEWKIRAIINELTLVTEEQFEIEKGTLWNGIRKRPYPEAKYCVIHAILIHFCISVSHTELGKLLNYGDHSTINYALKQFKDLGYDREYVRNYNHIITTTEVNVKKILQD